VISKARGFNFDHAPEALVGVRSTAFSQRFR